MNTMLWDGMNKVELYREILPGISAHPRQREFEALRVFLCSDLPLDDETTFGYYSQYWKIEALFCSQKRNLQKLYGKGCQGF